MERDWQSLNNASRAAVEGKKAGAGEKKVGLSEIHMVQSQWGRLRGERRELFKDKSLRWKSGQIWGQQAPCL